MEQMVLQLSSLYSPLYSFPPKLIPVLICPFSHFLIVFHSPTYLLPLPKFFSFGIFRILGPSHQFIQLTLYSLTSFSSCSNASVSFAVACRPSWLSFPRRKRPRLLSRWRASDRRSASSMPKWPSGTITAMTSSCWPNRCA